MVLLLLAGSPQKKHEKARMFQTQNLNKVQ